MLELTRAAFARFAEIHPGAALRVTQALGQRLQKHRLAAALHLGPIFAGFDPGVLRDLESELELFTLYGGETLFRQGEPGDYLCFVISGHLRVSVRFAEGPSRDVARLGPGEIVGEMALVSGEPRSSTVDAMRDTQLAKLSKKGYDRFVVEHPAWAVQLVSRKLAERLRDANAGGASRRPLRTIAVVPVHPIGAQWALFTGLGFGPGGVRVHGACHQQGRGCTFGPARHIASFREGRRQHPPQRVAA